MIRGRSEDRPGDAEGVVGHRHGDRSWRILTCKEMFIRGVLDSGKLNRFFSRNFQVCNLTLLNLLNHVMGRPKLAKPYHS
jgi:hypothetical protein